MAGASDLDRCQTELRVDGVLGNSPQKYPPDRGAFRFVLATVAAVLSSAGPTSLSPLRREAPIEYYE